MDLIAEQAIDIVKVKDTSEETLKSNDIIGHIFNSCAGNQLAHWICLKDIISEEHSHEFDECFAVLQGKYVISMNGKIICLEAGSEFFIPAKTPHSGKMFAGTSIFHIFGGHRPPGVP